MERSLKGKQTVIIILPSIESFTGDKKKGQVELLEQPSPHLSAKPRL